MGRAYITVWFRMLDAMIKGLKSLVNSTIEDPSISTEDQNGYKELEVEFTAYHYNMDRKDHV